MDQDNNLGNGKVAFVKLQTQYTEHLKAYADFKRRLEKEMDTVKEDVSNIKRRLNIGSGVVAAAFIAMEFWRTIN